MPDQNRWEEQLLSHLAKQFLSSQVDQGEDLEVEVHTNLGQMLQGEAESISIAGQNLELQQDLHLQEINVEIAHLDLNPFSLLLNKLELDQPLDTMARVVVSEADINQLLNSDTFNERLAPMELTVDGQLATVELQRPLQLHLVEGNKMIFDGTMVSRVGDQTQRVRFTGTLYPRTEHHSVLLEQFHCHDGHSVSLELVTALLKKVTELINLPYFEQEGMAYRIKTMEVEPGQMTVQVEARLQQIPDL
jgi:hypothetical protein